MDTRGRIIRRRLGVSVLVAVFVAGISALPVVTAAADPVVLQPGELVVNGGAEQPITVGWTGALARASHGVSGYPASVIVGPSGATGGTYPGGTALFTGIGGSSIATQTIDLSPSAAAIDNGNVDALASAYVGGYAVQEDRATLTYDFRDGTGASVATVAFGPVTRADRGSVSGFVPFSQTVAVPAGTRSVAITIETQRYVAPANDGYVDNVSLILDAPSPVANPDTGSTNQGTPVTVIPATNDVPGAGAAIVPASVRLLNGSTPVTTVTNADGTYTVDTASGDVLFTPDPSFFGTTQAVPYRVTDSSGQVDDSTITITVAFVASAGLSLVKSASPSDPASYTTGTVVTYSFVVTNTGNITMNGLTIDDGDFSGSDPLGTPVCPVTTLVPGEQTTCTVTYTVTAADVAALGISNTATATAIPEGTVVPFTSAPSSFGIPLTPAPAIELVKSVDAGGATGAGDSIAYSFLVTNTGNVAVSGITITEDAFSGDVVPAANCSTASILPGQSITCTASYTLTQDDVDAGTVTNTAHADAIPASGGSVASAASTASVSIAAVPSLTFTKSASRTTISAAGQSVVYTFRIANTGNVTLTNPVINDTEFSGAGELTPIVCPETTVAPAGILDCSATYTTLAADLSSTILDNSATADVDDPSGATLTSATSTVAIPITLPTPPTGPSAGADGSGLADTGGDPTGLWRLGLGLLVVGLALTAVVGLRRWRTPGTR